MKRLVLTVLLLIASVSFMAQEVINITFTSSTGNGLYCPFSTVGITNLTKSWSENIYYPDTVLALGNTLGIDEVELANRFFYLSDVYPNPSNGEACAVLKLYDDRDVSIQVLHADGAIVVSKKLHLNQGNYRIKLNLSASQLMYLTVSSGNLFQAVKLFIRGSSYRNSIDVECISVVEKSDCGRMVSSMDFEPGDLMRYEAQFTDGDYIINSFSIIQPQYYDDTVTLVFDVDLPTVLTNDVVDITWNSAVCEGEVINDGNAIIVENGICWSTRPGPDTSCNHTVGDSNMGPIRLTMLNLEANTNYYVRAYAVNSLGINYGEEIMFATSDLPYYNIEATTNYDNGGSVFGAGNYQLGQTCTLHATANEGCYFVGWSENGNQISTDSNYTFIVNGNRNINACFFPSYNFYEGKSDDYSIFSQQTNANNIYMAFDSLMENHPTFITKQCIGTACDGQNLYCYDFGGIGGTDKPKIIIICSQHGFEKNSTFGTFFFLKDVAENDSTTPFLDYVYEKLHIIVVPVVNPSGFNAFTYKNANGVNLNRNWPVENWTVTEVPSHYNYSGLSPLDQPETRVVDSIINMNLDALLFVDFHTNGAGPVSAAGQINWLSFPKIEDSITRVVITELSNAHLDSVSSNFKRIYGDVYPSLLDAQQLGFITIAQQWGTTGYADVSMAQRRLMALTFEGFNGFPGESSPFQPVTTKANSELLGDFLYWFCRAFNTFNYQSNK